MIESSKKIVALTIAEKINSQQKIKVADIDELDILVTELDSNAEIFAAYKEKGITII
jgi:DeoR/GlpR family transcriptional regulator of sugar metabolism